MKVILQQDIKGSGKKGDMVTVSDGYARNYLLPRKLVIEANAQAMGEMNARNAAEEHKLTMLKQEAQTLADELKGKTVKLVAKAGANGKLFGSVTSKEISEELKKQFNATVDKRKIALDDEIKSFGSYTAQIKLHAGITSEIYVIVGADNA